MKDPLIRIPVGRVWCCYCDKDFSVKKLSYLDVRGVNGIYKLPHCPGCASPISLDRLKINDTYVGAALKKSTELFLESGKDPEKNEVRFITLCYQGGISGCAAIWPMDMKGEARANQLDSYISKVFNLKWYSRNMVPKEFENCGVPFKFVYVEVSEDIIRTPIADFRLN